jgi:hypothetical protein
VSNHDDSGRTERTAPDGAAETRRRSPLFIVLGLLTAAIAVAIAIWSTQSGERSEAPVANMADPGAGRSEKAPKGEAASTSSAQLAAAFEAAFGKTGVARLTAGDDTRTFRPTRLLRVGDKFVLLSEGTNVSDCHACSGALAIHYLRARSDGFAVVGSWPDLIRGYGWGRPPDWTVSEEFNTYPTVVEEGGYTAQGCTSGGVTLTELRPDKPVQTGLVRTHFDNASGFGELNGQSIDGSLGNIRKDASFEVAYSGARSFTEKWVKKGDVYLLETGETKMPQC